jgi:pilus assembly protein CpaC
LRELGVNWSSMLQSSRFVFSLVTANPVTMTDNLARNTATLGFTEGSNKVDAIIDALGQEGLVTILAEPNLTALSGQTASFLAGGEFPIPVAQQGGVDTSTISVVFKKFGVALDFTPTILDSRRINLRVRPEVSQISDVGAVQLGTFNIPALSVRRAETSVELASGESFAIAGLLQNTDKLDTSKIPALGDLPVLGALFRSDRFKRSETELAILVTPYLVRPAPAPALAVPTDPVASATGSDTVSDSASGTGPSTVAPVKNQAGGPMTLIGPAGFVLD